MITIVAEFDIKEDKVNEFLDVIKPLVEASNTEAGCLKYELNQNLNAENKFAMIEAWKDQAAIDSHNNSEHFTSIIPQLGGFVNSATKVSLYNKIL